MSNGDGASDVVPAECRATPSVAEAKYYPPAWLHLCQALSSCRNGKALGGYNTVRPLGSQAVERQSSITESSGNHAGRGTTNRRASAATYGS